MSDSAVTVGGRYRLVETIGRGGMGTVWKAHDEVLGRDVAVKEVMPPADLQEEERAEFALRTFREARAAGRVAHPGVATVYDVLEEDGHPWIVMQLLRSRTLGDVIRESGPMSPLEAARIGLQLLEALRAAHAAGVLHRDVKPDNVLLAEDGRAVLTDFGIATTEDEAPLTRTGVLIGTPSFMAPERAAGSRAEAASDLWSLGVTLYLAVEGHSPFQRDSALATLGAVMHAEPAPLARAGVLAPLVLGLLRKDPGTRMSLDEAARRLSLVLLGGSPEQRGPVASAVAGRGGRAALAAWPTPAGSEATQPGGPFHGEPPRSHRPSGDRPLAHDPTARRHRPSPYPALQRLRPAGDRTIRKRRTAGDQTTGKRRATGEQTLRKRRPAGDQTIRKRRTVRDPSPQRRRPDDRGGGFVLGRPVRRRWPALAALAGGALVVAIVAGGAAWWSHSPRDLPRTPATVPAVTGAPGTTPRPSEATSPRGIPSQNVVPQSSPPPTKATEEPAPSAETPGQIEGSDGGRTPDDQGTGGDG